MENFPQNECVAQATKDKEKSDSLLTPLGVARAAAQLTGLK